MEERYTLNTDSSLIRSITGNLTKKNESFIKISNEFTLDNSAIEAKNNSIDSIKDESSINASLNLSRKSLKVIKLHQINTKNVPPLNDYSDIEMLNLEGNMISTLDSIPKKLAGINLRENKISFFPKVLISAHHLEVLDLSHNRLINLDGIKNLSKLRELYLGYNYISDEQLGVIECLKDLEILDISHNHIKEEDAIRLVETLPRLRKFVNNLNEYTEICFKKQSNALECLQIEENNLYVIEFQESKYNLKTMSLKNNRLAELLGIEHLPGLQNLHLDNNKLKNLEILKNLERLITVTAGGNTLQSVVLPARSSIENLDLSNNSLNAFEFLKNAVNIKFANLSENRIDSFMGSACSLSNLIKLDLSKNKLKDVFNMSRFPNLRELNLSFNQINDSDSLIIELSKLNKLVSIDLRANKFNLSFDFDSIIPHGGVLASLEALESILKPSKEDQFKKFIQYRSRFITNLSDTITTLDRITITSYELSLNAMRSNPRSPFQLRTPISPTPTNDMTLNIGGPSLFDVNITSSIDTALSSAIFASDNKRQQGTGLFNPMHMNSEFMEEDSLVYSKGTRSHNTTASKINNNFTPPPKNEYDSSYDPTSKSRSRYQSVYNSQNLSKNGLPITPEEFFEEEPKLNQRPPVPAEEKSRMKERQMLKAHILPVIPDELSEHQDSIHNENRRHSEASRDEGRKINDSKHTATFNNSFQSFQDKFQPFQPITVNQNDSLFDGDGGDKELNSSKHIQKLAEKFEHSRNLLNQVESRKSANLDELNGVSVHSELSELANELTKDYQKQLHVLKGKVKDKLKKIKETEVNKQRDDEEKRKPPADLNFRKMSPTNQQIHQQIVELDKENRRPSSTKSNHLESTHGSRYSHKSRKDAIPKPNTPTTIVAKIIIPSPKNEEMDNFFTEKVIERLESDERIATNPYYHMYKEMLHKKNKLPERFSSNERSSERHQSRQSYQSRRDSYKEVPENQKPKEKPAEKRNRSPLVLDPIVIDDNIRVNSTINTTAAFNSVTEEKLNSSKHSNQVAPKIPSRQSTPQRESIKVTQTVQTSPTLEEKYQIQEDRSQNSREVTPKRESVFSNFGSEHKTENKSDCKDKSQVSSLKNSVSVQATSVQLHNRSIQINEEQLSITNLEVDPKKKLNMSKSDSAKKPEVFIPHSNEDIQVNDFAIKLFRERAPKSKGYLTSLNLINVFKDFLDNFKIEVTESVLEELFDEIEDFVPRKITEKAFVDIFHLPRIKEFLGDLGVHFNYQTARFAGISKHADIIDALESYDDKPEKLDSSKPKGSVRNESRGRNDYRERQDSNERSQKKHRREDSNPKSGNKWDVDNSIHSISMITNAESFLKPNDNEPQYNPKNKRQSLDTTLNLSKLEDLPHSSKKKKYFRHSLTDSDFKAMQKSSAHEIQEEECVKLSLKDIVGPDAATIYHQLSQYATTPPRPIFNKDTQPNLLKDIVPCSAEFNLISNLLSTENFDLKRVLKIYSYNQQKKISKLIEERHLTSPLMSAHGGNPIPPPKKLTNYDALVKMNGNSMFFEDKILLFHTGKLNFLSQLVENTQGFKDVYKERPGDLIFSHRSHICQRSYKRFMKKLEKKGGHAGFGDNSFLNNVAERPTWRLVISQVYLGTCYVENKMNFKEFAYFGELKVLELLRDGFTSIYFEKNDLYLVLLAEHCTPVYLCEYQFDNTAE